MAQLIDDLVLDASAGVHRPRNLDWKRAAALLYGDWGTSKAYVIGLAFIAAGFSSLPIILAVCAVTSLVGINYIVICRHFPDGGGVYSSARSQGRLLAVVGALLLVADLTVTAALSGWSALSYVTSGAEHIIWIKFLRDHIALTTIGVLLVMGLIKFRCSAGAADGSGSNFSDRAQCAAFDHAISRATASEFHHCLGAVRWRDPGLIRCGIGRESHRRDEARSGIDDGTPAGRA